MWKKIVAVIMIMMMMFGGLVLRLHDITSSASLADVAETQATVRVDIGEMRGTIYDTHGEKLTNVYGHTLALVSPLPAAAPFLLQNNPELTTDEIFGRLAKGKPFVVPVEDDVGNLKDREGIYPFEIFDNMSPAQDAEHLIGIGGNAAGSGKSGLQLAFDSWLSAGHGVAQASYKANAAQGTIYGEQPEITNTLDKSKQGVVLTLDKEIQRLVQTIGQDAIEQGAIVISEIPDNKIRASVSFPRYSPTNIAQYLENTDSPFINRATSAYDLGSVFKLVSSAALLEAGVSPDYRYNCEGQIDVNGVTFHCSSWIPHGDEDMQNALANSCNCYFINAIREIGYERFLILAENLGFGESFTLAPGFHTDSGNLPFIQTLRLPAGLANLAMGQGELLATPLQVTALVNAIASGGYYCQPQLVESLVDENMTIQKAYQPQIKMPVISKKTTDILKQFMKACVDNGTGVYAQPKSGGAGAKTGTAQTGMKDSEGNIIEQCWFTGFYPYENPKYVITVLIQGGKSGGKTAGPIFKEICDALGS